MLIVKIWHYFRGYVIINVKGRYLERFINLVHNNNILIWDIIKISSTSIYAKVELKDYVEISRISEKLSCEIELIKKKGMTLWKWKIKNRKVFPIGLILVFIILYFLSSFIITIEVIGNKKIDEMLIINELEELGLKSWIRKSSIDLDKIKTDFLRMHKELDYMNIEFYGTKVKVEINESQEQQKIFDKSIPVNIIAQKDGIIKDMLVINGTPCVKIDQLVHKGDLLIKGTVTIGRYEEDQSEIFIHAMGKIMAETKTTKEYEIKKYKIIDSDDFTIKRILHLGNFTINFNKEDNSFYYYEGHEEKTLSLFGRKLPIKIDKLIYYNKDNCTPKKKEEADMEVFDKVNEDFRELGTISEIQITNIIESNNTFKYQLSITLIEDICEEKMIN